MPLELRRAANGRIRRIWYGRYMINGQRFCSSLSVRVAGTPPASLSLMDEGDLAFERSRERARAKLDALVEEARTTRDAARLVEKIYTIKTGEVLEAQPLEGLPEAWAKIPRKRPLAKTYVDQTRSVLARFVVFMRRHYPAVKEVAQITRPMARDFLDAEAQRGVAGRTWNEALVVLRGTMRHLLPPGGINPFADIPSRESQTIFRKPFTADELKAIVEAAQGDDFIRPIIITGICTAMRRGDCCLLRWADVDMAARFLSVKTSKTGQMTSIPIFPMLYDELARRRQVGKYVFPEQAKMYLENSYGITLRVRRVLATAGFVDPADVGAAVVGAGEKAPDRPVLPAGELIAKAKQAVAECGTSVRRGKVMLAVLRTYLDGKAVDAVAKEHALSQSSVSLYLNTIEKLTGAAVVRRPVRFVPAVVRGEIHATRKQGLRRVSIRDFHSLRVTWVTLALTAGVPLELVQKVTGHQTAAIVLKHYFQPGREDFRRALESAMPALLTSGQKTPAAEVREIIGRMTPETAEEDKARILELVTKLG